LQPQSAFDVGGDIAALSGRSKGVSPMRIR
jgi:hypothetical protein